MYQIIGGDGREYGPVTDEDLCKWIAEGRLSAQSMAKGEGDAQFRPLAEFPEFAGAFGMTPPLPGAAAARAIDWNKRDYDLDIGGCFSRGWALFWDNLGILLGCTALYVLIYFGGVGVVNAMIGGVLAQIVPDTVVYSATFTILQGVGLQVIAALFVGPLVGGYYYVFIQALRGQTPSVGDMFIGFRKSYSQLFIGWLVINVLTLLCFIPFYIVWAARAGPVLIHLKHTPNPNELHGQLMDLWGAFTGTCPIILLCMIPMIYVSICFRFTLALIIDQGMDVWTAMGTSWKMVHRHWLTVFVLVFIAGFIYMAGFFLCCFGSFFTVGIATATTMFAYEAIFCERRRD